MYNVETLPSADHAASESEVEANVNDVAADDGSSNEAQQEDQSAEKAEHELNPEERLKKLQKAKERDSRKIGKLHAKFSQERERSDRLEQAFQELSRRFVAPEQQGPVETDPKYKTYSEYLDDKTKYTSELVADQKIKAFQEQQQLTNQQNAWVQERQRSLDTEVSRLKTDLPDYDAVIAPHEATIAALPQQIKLLALSTDNAALAAYQLAQEDAIDDLLDMTPDEAKSALAQAAKRGLAAIQARKTTKAPAPLSQTKGTANGGKTLDRMTAEEVVKWATGR